MSFQELMAAKMARIFGGKKELPGVSPESIEQELAGKKRDAMFVPDLIKSLGMSQEDQKNILWEVATTDSDSRIIKIYIDASKIPNEFIDKTVFALSVKFPFQSQDNKRGRGIDSLIDLLGKLGRNIISVRTSARTAQDYEQRLFFIMPPNSTNKEIGE